MLKVFLATSIVLFVSLSQAARIINFDGYLGLRSDLPSSNFIELAFPKVKNAINDCQSGNWKDWQTATSKGRTCDSFNWVKDLQSGCESIVIQDESAAPDQWSVAFVDKATCATEDLYIRKYSTFHLVDEATYEFEIVLKGMDAIGFCRALAAGGAPYSEVDGWRIWNLNNLAQCRVQQDQLNTLEAKINFK
jgi:hypothetical protein